jgi:hypothetical protein
MTFPYKNASPKPRPPSVFSQERQCQGRKGAFHLLEQWDRITEFLLV